MAHGTILLPVSAVVPTRHRSVVLSETLESLAEQSAQPAEIIIIDASTDRATIDLLGSPPEALRAVVRYESAKRPGAARQRNQGVALATHPTIFFFDDDVLFEPECVQRLWDALEEDPSLGGVNSMVRNEQYGAPGRMSLWIYKLLDDQPGVQDAGYAGRLLGPGLNLLPEDRPELPEVVPIEWLNTTSTMYRREHMPNPPFPESFTGYSLCEDLVLSQLVRERAKLANARTARIVHKSVGGAHKQSRAELVRMSLANRYFVMRKILKKSGIGDHFKFGIWQLFDLLAQARAQPRQVPSILVGMLKGCWSMLRLNS